MNVRRIQDNTTFGIKNTFLNRAKNAGSVLEKRYWESLHNEAKAKLNYMKFEKAEKELKMVKESDTITLVAGLLAKMAYRKVKSVIYLGKAHCKFPNRFAEPDSLFGKEAKFYNVKGNFPY